MAAEEYHAEFAQKESTIAMLTAEAEAQKVQHQQKIDKLRTDMEVCLYPWAWCSLHSLICLPLNMVFTQQPSSIMQPGLHKRQGLLEPPVSLIAGVPPVGSVAASNGMEQRSPKSCVLHPQAALPMHPLNTNTLNTTH